MRLIDAEALRESFYKKFDKEELQYTQPFIHASLILLEKFIDHAPTIEAKPVVHAHWKKENDLFFVCSNCGTTCPYNFESDFITHWECKYCPICGAQMDEKESD